MIATSSKFSARFLPLVASVFTLVLVQDFLHAMLRDYNFYLSEALLFASFWLLFIPLFWIRTTWLKPLTLPSSPRLYFVLRTILLTAIHLVFYAVILFVASFLLLNDTYALGWSLRYAVSDTLYFALFGYGVMELMSWRDNEVPNQALSVSATPEFPARIAVSSKNGTLYLEGHEIVLLRSASPYVELLAGGSKYLESTTLKALSAVLDPKLFVRIHRSCIVNLACVREQRSRGNGDYDLLLHNGEQVRMSRNYAAEFKRRMETHQLSLS